MVQFRQIEAMEEAASSLLVPLRMTVPADRPFQGEVTDATVGPVGIFRVSATVPGQVRRLPGLIGSGDRPLIKVVVQRRGDAIVSQDGRQGRVGPGDLIAYDTNRPYEYIAPEPINGVVIALPQPMLGPGGDLVLRRTAISVPGDRGIRSVIAAFFSGLADTVLDPAADQASGAEAVRLADTMASLLVTAFTGTPCERVEQPTALVDQMLSYALANLHDPGLSAASVARRFGISPRYLHTLMRGRDIQFAAWVRHERLKRIRQDLLDPRLANLTAAAIAARWGVLDPGHLSRSLRAEFGCGAAELRACAGRT